MSVSTTSEATVAGSLYKSILKDLIFELFKNNLEIIFFSNLKS